jgi:hypothetical protein
MRERDIERHLAARVNDLGGEVRKVRWVGRRGAPDRFVMLPGRGIWVELKAPGEPVPAYQEREHERMRRMGQGVVVIDTLAGVDKLLQHEPE